MTELPSYPAPERWTFLPIKEGSGTTWAWCSGEITTETEKKPFPLGQTYTTWEENTWPTKITKQCWYAALSTMRWPFVWPTLVGHRVAHPCVLQWDFVAFGEGHSLLWAALVEDGAHRQPGKVPYTIKFRFYITTRTILLTELLKCRTIWSSYDLDVKPLWVSAESSEQ